MNQEELEKSNQLITKFSGASETERVGANFAISIAASKELIIVLNKIADSLKEIEKHFIVNFP